MGAKSTPVATRIKEKELSIDDLFNLTKSSFKEQKSNFDEVNVKLNDEVSVKLNEQNEIRSDTNEHKIKCESNFNELNKRLDINDVKLESKFDELKSGINNMKLQNFNIDKRLKEIDEQMCIRDSNNTFTR